MKKVLFAFLIAGFIPYSAFAASKKQARAMHDSDTGGAMERSGAVAGEPDTDGCGLGWQVTAKKTIIASITRGTTNSIVPPSFGMTSGTLGCAQHPFTKRDEQAAVYAMTNFDSLTIDMAEGKGEYLEGFARTLGCQDQALGEFSRMTQSNYRSISEGGKASAVKMMNHVKDQIRQNPVLSAACSA